MQLHGHGGEVYCARFSPDGQALASAGFDKTILLWRIYGEECENYMLIRCAARGGPAVAVGHAGRGGGTAVPARDSAPHAMRGGGGWKTSLAPTHGRRQSSAPARVARPSGQRRCGHASTHALPLARPPLVPHASGHKNAVLQLAWFPSGEHLVTASADKSVRCWDADTGLQVKRLTEHTAVVNSVCPMHRGQALFVSGSDDGNVKVRWQRGGHRGQQLSRSNGGHSGAPADSGAPDLFAALRRSTRSLLPPGRRPLQHRTGPTTSPPRPHSAVGHPQQAQQPHLCGSLPCDRRRLVRGG